MVMMKFRWVFGVMVVSMTGALCAGVAFGDEVAAEHVRALVEAGAVLPLDQLLKAIPPHWQGRLIDAELERDDGLWVYELEILGRDGYVRELALDASTGKILEVEYE